MSCDACGTDADRTIAAYWDRTLKLCSACCTDFGSEADDEHAWPDAPEQEPRPPFYYLTEDLELVERAIAPGRAVAVCDTCGDDSTTLVGGTDSRCIMTPGCEGRRRAGPAYEPAPRRRRGSTPRQPKADIPHGHYPCPQCGDLHDAFTDSGLRMLCPICVKHSADCGRNFIARQAGQR